MINLNEIKLIVWDLDETFWDGTLSEGYIRIIEKNINLVKRLTDCGIVNSICSKNDFDSVRKKLIEIDMWDYFVFPKISWQPKGEVIKSLIHDMNLRSCNVLFIDDNPSNREEALFYAPDLCVCAPIDIDKIIEQCSCMDVSDQEHKRLAQYKVLEVKQDEWKHTSSNEEFLFNSNIKVEILYDCNSHKERIHELILRTNQLNFTKNRISIMELEEILVRPDINCGYVHVSDKFGDYGISGFFSVKNGELLHFLFSCRTMGMGIEQYVYAYLGFPKLFIQGKVAYQLNDRDVPNWINQANQRDLCSQGKSIFNEKQFHALIKGPCDMEQVLGYIENEEYFEKEFTYVTPQTGVSIESYNHTWHMVEGYNLSELQKKTIIEELPFSSPEFFSKRVYASENDIVFFSLFTDPNLGLYKRKTGEVIAFGEYTFDLTNPDNWEGYIDGSIFNANCKFEYKFLEDFSEKYEYIGRISPSDLLNNLKFIRKHMPQKTLLVLFTGVEFPYPDNVQKSCDDRHLYHKEINALVRNWAENEKNVKILDFGEIVKSPKDMLNNINHFIKPVYYEMAQRVILMISQNINNVKMKRRSIFYMWRTYFTQKNIIFRYYMKMRVKLAKFLGRNERE